MILIQADDQVCSIGKALIKTLRKSIYSYLFYVTLNNVHITSPRLIFTSRDSSGFLIYFMAFAIKMV